MSPERDSYLAEQFTAMDAALEALVVRNSFSHHPAGGNAVGSVLRSLLSLPGLESELVPSRSGRFADHLIFRSQGRPGARPVALLGHLDTVFPPGTFEGYRTEGALRRGPGTFDMKGGLVVLAWALKSLALTQGLDTVAPVRVVLVSDEEVGSPEGIEVIQGAIVDCQAALVFEPGRSNDAVVTSRKGTGSVSVTAHGKASHAGNAYWEGANAIWALAKFVDRAQQLSSERNGTTLNVGLITGGTTKNTVPDRATAELDLRYLDVHAGEALVQELKGLGDLCAEHVKGTRLEVTAGPQRAPMPRLPGVDELISLYTRAALAHGLGAGEAPLQGGGSDGNTAAAMGIPTLDGLGPRGGGFHTSDEHIVASTLVSRAQALAQFLADWSRE